MSENAREILRGIFLANEKIAQQCDNQIKEVLPNQLSNIDVSQDQ